MPSQPAGEGVGEQAIFVDVREHSGDGGMCGVAVHAEGLHLPQHSTPSLALDGDVVARPRPRRPPVVEQPGLDEGRQRGGDGIVRVVAAPEPESSL